MNIENNHIYREISSGQLYYASNSLVPFTEKACIIMYSIDFHTKTIGESIIASTKVESSLFEYVFKNELLKYNWTAITNAIKNKFKPPQEYTFETAVKDIDKLIDLKIVIDNNSGAASVMGYIVGIRKDGLYIKASTCYTYNFAKVALYIRNATTNMPIGPEELSN